MSNSKDFIKDAMEKVADIKDYCYAEGKKNGALDVWDFLKIWGSMSVIERKNIFGVSKVKDLVEKYTPIEAIYRLEMRKLIKERRQHDLGYNPWQE